MQEYNIDIGLKELYTLKNFSFDIINNGSADLQIENVSISSENVQISYIKTPFIIMLNTTYSMFGYLKILNNGLSLKNDYINFDVSLLDNDSTIHYDTYRYYLNYESIFYNTFTQFVTISNITYINNMLILYLDADVVIDEIPTIILVDIDGIQKYIFPKFYKFSDKKIVYIYSDNTIKNSVVNSGVNFFITNERINLELKQLTLRSI